MNKKGFTVVELMTTFVLVAIISTLLVKLVITLKEVYINGDMKTTLITKQSTMTDKIYKDLKEKDLKKVESCENKTNCVNFVYSDVTKTFIIDKDKKTVTYDNYTIKLGREGYLGDISIDKYNSDLGSILNFKVPIYNKLVKGNYGLNITYQVGNNIDFDENIVFDVQNKGVKVTFDANGGTVDTASKQVTVGESYGNLPIPEREGYEFKGWNGKNKILLYNIPAFGITVDNNGYVSDSSPTSDGRGWNYSAHDGWQVSLDRGSYTISLDFKEKSTQGDNRIVVNSAEKFYCNMNIANQDKVECAFDLTDRTDLNIVIKGYNGVYRVQLEEGSTATAYEPYYVESNTKVTQNKNHTLTAIWEKKESTFLDGITFNKKIKELAGDTNPSAATENTSITSVKRYTKKPKKAILNNAEVVSTSDSKYPIYAWFDNGTIYYYTEALNPYMNVSGVDMFQYLTKVKTIDVSTIDTSKTTAIQGLFHLDYKLESIDLSNFDTSNMTNMYAPFKDCSSLTSLDLSSFDMSKVTNTVQIIKNTSSLTTLKTPKAYPTDSSKTIDLPATFKDSSNNTYTSLNNTSPKSTTLTKQ